MPGSGKTTAGSLLARLLRVPFADMDDLFEQEHGMAPAEYLRGHGEAAFRDKEAETFERALSIPDRVVACGGGTLVRPRSLAAALKRSTVVYLSARVETLAARLGDASRHPLLSGARLDVALVNLLEKRQAGYRAAHAAVATDGLGPVAVALAVRESLRGLGVGPWTEPLSPVFGRVGRGLEAFVEMGLRSYPVRLSLQPGLSGLAAFLDVVAAGRRCVVVADRTAALRHAAALKLELHASGRRLVLLPAGELAKDVRRLPAVVKAMARAGLDRTGVVVAVGGGSALDAAGFAASVYMRGVPAVYVPTTLLAALDACVGGKTALDVPGGKNLIGSITQPLGVFVPVGVVGLEVRERKSPDGVAEHLKTCLLSGNTEEIGRLARPWKLPQDALAAVIARCLEYKIRVVAADEREQDGQRTVLNLGHTFAHALEAASGYRLAHGRAVGAGLVLAAQASVRLGVAEPALASDVERWARSLGLYPLEPRLDLGAASRLIASDKKRVGRGIRLVLLERPGCPLVRTVPLKVAEYLMATEP
jgi:3-dehydroquinate synthetase/shikimate kinase